MIKNLLEKLFKEIEHENDCDKKTKNGISIYFVEKILEEKFGKPNYISPKTIKGYYEKYVNGKENNSGEPSFELKNLIAQYLNYDDFSDFVNDNSETKNKRKKKGTIYKTKWFGLSIIMVIVIFGFYYRDLVGDENCIVWKIDHYEKIDCKNKSSEPHLKGLDIKKFKKITVSDTTTFFVKGRPIVWYGKSKNGEIEFFNSRGVHPFSKKDLKPITEYIINKYVYTSK